MRTNELYWSGLNHGSLYRMMSKGFSKPWFIVQDIQVANWGSGIHSNYLRPRVLLRASVIILW